MPRKIPRLLWVVLPLGYFLYFFRPAAVGLIGPDEPRYASIAREMARSGDWITPRLWGQPWFEKPALSYWMSALGFRLGLGPELAPRLPVAVLAVGFLIFFWWIVRREFGYRQAWFSVLILGTCGLWVAYSQVGVTDIPLAAPFSAAMLLLLPWIARRETKYFPVFGALLGAAVLAKGLVPLVLCAPPAIFVWWRCGRSPAKRLAQAAAAFSVVAVPWYLLCYLRNGPPFLKEFFWKHHFERAVSTGLQHGQPWWFYLPVFVAALLPWTPLLGLLGRREAYRDPRRLFLLLWAAAGLVFFSAALNKLPGYVLPLLPAAALLAGLALDETRRAGAWLAASALLLVVLLMAAPVLGPALESGLSKSALPSFRPIWLAPLAIAGAAWILDRRGRRLAAVALIAAGTSAGVVYVKQAAFADIDRLASSRSLWREISRAPGEVCIEHVDRDWRYGLNYYSIQPLPDCQASPRRLGVRGNPGQPPSVGLYLNGAVDPVSPTVVLSPFRN